MGIENFPAALQPIIQQGFLSRKFRRGLMSKLGYRKVAERRTFPNSRWPDDHGYKAWSQETRDDSALRGVQHQPGQWANI